MNKSEDIDFDPVKQKLLIEKGIIPSPSEAKKTFFALGEKMWLQFIDSQHQKFGSLVYDKGLHGGHKEPGYLEGINKACNYIGDQFEQPFSMNIYKTAHHKACEHFQGNDTDTLCDVSEIDLFRKIIEGCQPTFYTPKALELANKKRELCQYKEFFTVFLLLKMMNGILKNSFLNPPLH